MENVRYGVRTYKTDKSKGTRDGCGAHHFFFLPENKEKSVENFLI